MLKVGGFLFLTFLIGHFVLCKNMIKKTELLHSVMMVIS